MSVAPGRRVGVVGQTGEGTSWASVAAAIVTAIANVMMEANGEVLGWPKVTRSILKVPAIDDVDVTFLVSDDCWRYANRT